MASDALFLALANAGAQPDRWARALGEGTKAATNILGGYAQGQELAEMARKRKIQQQTFGQSLGGRVPRGLEGFEDMTLEQANDLAKPISAIADLRKATQANEPEENVPVMTQDEALNAKTVNPKTKILNMYSQEKGNNQVVQNLRNQHLRESKEFSDISNRISNIFTSAKDPSPAGDLSMIYSYMKMLDPTSVVREGEFATAANTGSIPTQITAQYNKIVSGERLAPETRADFLKRSIDIYKGQQRNQLQRNAEFSRIAASQGVNPREVIVDMSVPIPSEFENPAATTKKTYQKIAKNAQGVTIGTNDNWATFEPVQGGQ